MSALDWWRAVPAAATALILLLGPGLVIARSWGLRRWAAAGAAIPLGSAVVGLAEILAARIGARWLPWGWAVIAALTCALALPGCRAMDTPLGPVTVEVPPQIEALADTGLVVTRPDVHAAEHSLEVQLPFLATVLPGADVVPLAVGWVAPDRAAEAILPFLGSPDTLVVVSSDLSHYLPQTEARRVDDATIERILALRADIDHEEACGATGVNALLLAAGQRGLRPRLLGAATSADTIGDPARVVGYAAVAFYEE